MTTVITNTTTPSHDKDFFSKIVFGLAYVLPCRPDVSKTWRPTTPPSPSIRPPLRTWFTLPSVNRPFYENDSFILDRNCETRTLKETLKKKIRAKFVYLTILKVIDKCFKWKSAYHLEDITECSKFPRFLFQIFLNFILNTKTWVLLKSTSHLDRERFLSHQLF